MRARGGEGRPPVTALERGIAIVLAGASAAGLAWASNAPMTAHGTADAVLRLAWSARPERVEHCRQLSEEELEQVPRHMRQDVVCEGISATYRLEVRHDGRVIAEQDVRGGGLRNDRRLYVFRDLPLPPGEALVSVRLSRIDLSGEGSDDADDNDEEDNEAGEKGRHRGRHRTVSNHHGDSVPRHLSFERRLRFSPREVILVTFVAERRALVAVQRPQPPAR